MAAQQAVVAIHKNKSGGSGESSRKYIVSTFPLPFARRPTDIIIFLYLTGRRIVRDDLGLMFRLAAAAAATSLLLVVINPSSFCSSPELALLHFRLSGSLPPRRGRLGVTRPPSVDFVRVVVSSGLAILPRVILRGLGESSISSEAETESAAWLFST